MAANPVFTMYRCNVAKLLLDLELHNIWNNYMYSFASSSVLIILSSSSYTREE